VNDAALPSAPISPDYSRNLMVGGVIGILLGYLGAFVRMNLDRKLRSVDEVEDLIESPVLAILPDVKDLDRKQTEGLDRSNRGPAAEAFRQLRTNFRFIDVDNPIRTVVITSANEGEGKSTVAANLARVLANAGQDTVLVDADLRRPVVAGVYGVDSQIGLAQVLVGDVTADEALQETSIEHLKVMSAGRVPHNPSELLGSLRMQQLLHELARDHLVVLDAPPLLPVTDAALLAAIADGAMVVFAIGTTYKEQARLAKRRLEQTGGRMLGVVLNRAPLKGLGAVVYGYGYGSYTSSYGEDAPPSNRPGARKKAALAKTGSRSK
jgi:succinoglycan biosynthesis transport protein ExoP